MRVWCGRSWVAMATVWAGCGGGHADVSGSLGPDASLDKVVTVFNGGPNIVMFDRKIDCLDTFWVNDSYVGASPPYLDSNGGNQMTFVGLQFSFVSGDPAQVGTFSVAGQAVVAGWGLVANGAEWSPERARDGTLTLTEVDPDDAFVEGNFDVAFGAGQVIGEFHSEYCRNIDPG